MIEAYRIGIAIALDNQISGPLATIIAELTKAQQGAAALVKSLEGIGAASGVLTAAAVKVGVLNKEMGAAAMSAERMAAAMGATKGAAMGGGGNMHMQQLPVGLGGKGPHRGGMWDAGMAPVGGPKSTHLNGVPVGLGGKGPRPAIAPKSEASPWDQLFAGAIMMEAGKGAIGGLYAPIQADRDYTRAFAKFKTLNLGAKANAQADNLARTGSPASVSGTEMMEMLGNMVGLAGDTDTAYRIAPQIAELNKANSLIFSGKIDGMDERATRALMKFLDRGGYLKNITDPKDKRFMEGVNLAEKIVSGSGGALQFRDLDQFSQVGGTAFRTLSDEGRLMMAGIMQEEGGSKAGTSMMSGFQNIVAGRTPKKAMKLAESLGLGHIDEVKSGTTGGKKSTTTTFHYNPDLEAAYMENPVKFGQMIIPILQAHGYKTDNEFAKVLNDLLSNRKASGQQTYITGNMVGVMRDYKVTKGAMDADQTIGEANKTPDMAWIKLSASWDKALRELGTVGLPLAIKGVSGLTKALDYLAPIIQKHPETIKALGVAIGGLAVAATVSGAILLVNGAFALLAKATGGGLVASLSGVATGLGAIAAAAASFGIAYKAGEYATAHSSILQNGVNGATDWLNKHGLIPKSIGGGPLPEINGAISQTEINRRKSIVGPSKPDILEQTEKLQQGGKSFIGSPAKYKHSQGDVYLDGKKVGKVMSRELASLMTKDASRNVSSSRFDGRMSLENPAFA